MLKSKTLRPIAALLSLLLLLSLAACGGGGDSAGTTQPPAGTQNPAPAATPAGESGGDTGGNNNSAGGTPDAPITLHVLENDTAKAEGYLDALLKAFNEAYADQGIVAVDANMDEFTDLAMNGPYGYGPDVLYQANDQLMQFAEDKHILPLNAEELDCWSTTPEAAWDAFRLNLDGNSYLCGVPVNIQEPMLFYREDQMPADWQTKWDKDGNGTPDFFENWCDLYALSKEIHEADSSKFGFMASLNNLYLASPFMLSYGNYIFGEKDGVLDAADIGFSKGNAVNGLMALRQFAGLMNEGCIDDTITLNRYEKIADGSYFCSVSTPDTYSLFVGNLTNRYVQDGMSQDEASAKAVENLKMVEMPSKMPANGDLSQDSASVTDWVDTICMGGINGYAVSSYTKYREASIAFVNFATSFDMIQTRAEMLGIAPTRKDVAEVSGDTADTLFQSLAAGRIYLMPSIKAVDQIWVPSQTLMGDIAKDPFRVLQGDPARYPDKETLQTALENMDQQIYDAIHTLAG